MEIEKRRNRRVVLFPLPLQGHINPMLQLSHILHAKGFAITIIHTTLNSPDPSKHSTFTFHSFDEGLSQAESASMDNVVALLSLLNAKCVAPFTDCLTKLVSAHHHHNVACLITDAIWHFTQAVAVSLNLPRIVLRTSSLCSFLAFAAWPLLKLKGYISMDDPRKEETIVELPPLKVKDIPVIKAQEQESLSDLLKLVIQETKASSGIIWNSYEELEVSILTKCREEFPVQHFLLGPFHKHFPATSSSLMVHDQTCISWLHAHPPRSVLYISFGSLATLSQDQFLEMAHGLANSCQPFLWVVRPGLVHGSDWIEALSDGFLESLSGKGHIVKWAPQQEVLAHHAVGGFWTHNGWNSTMESICEGVPMICLPFFGDQMVNARYVSHVWRVGLNLEWRMERNVIEKVVKKLLLEEEGKEMRDKILLLKDEAQLCMETGGSAHHDLDSLVTYILSF